MACGAMYVFRPVCKASLVIMSPPPLIAAAVRINASCSGADKSLPRQEEHAQQAAPSLQQWLFSKAFLTI